MGNFPFQTAAWSDFGLYWNNWKGIKQEDQQEDCIWGNILNQTSICAHWFRHSLGTRADRPPAKPLWILIEKMACVSYYGSMFSISLRLCCVIIYWRALPVYMLILREGHVLSIEMFCAAREDPNICLFWTVHVHLCWAENKKKYTIFWCTQNSVCFITMLNI